VTLIPHWPGRMLSLSGGEEVWIRENSTSNSNFPNGFPRLPSADVLCVHGMAGAATNWTDFMAELSPEFACTAVDLPGSGHSPPPKTTAGYSIRALARTVARLIEDHLTVPVHLAGNSMGGAVSVRLAATRPDLVRTLTLISPALPDPQLHAGLLQFPLLALPRVGARLMRRAAAMPAWQRVTGVANTCFFDPGVIHPGRFADEVAELERRDRLSYSGDVMIGAARAITREYLRPGIASLWRDAERIRVPVLAVYGSHDRLVHPRGAARAARAFRDAPDANVLVLPRSGHVAQMEHPARVAALFREMVERTVGMTDTATGLSPLT
jgi:pimeloyl-ACP methyl ester carboxylesterase